MRNLISTKIALWSRPVVNALNGTYLRGGTVHGTIACDQNYKQFDQYQNNFGSRCQKWFLTIRQKSKSK